MKRVLLLILAAALLLLTVAGCSSETKSIEKVYVNDQVHVIVEYSDGTIDDLGYVGIETVPPQYTVTFLDANGETFKTQTVYRGQDATPPDTPPTLAGSTFDKWDVEFTNVQGDLTVRPQFTGKATYTVMFIDQDGNTLKTEKVIEGGTPTAPTPPTVEGKVFERWSVYYGNVKKDLTVRALYRDSGTFTVTFADYDGRVLGTESVQEGRSVSAPVLPTREGYTFSGWSSSLDKITTNKTVTAQYKFNGGTNVLDIAHAIKGNSVTLTLTVRGNVAFCGADLVLKAPTGMTVGTVTPGAGVVANKDGNNVLINVASTTNLTAETKLVTVTFTNSNATTANFVLTVSEFFDQNMNDAPYTIIGKTFALK